MNIRQLNLALEEQELVQTKQDGILNDIDNERLAGDLGQSAEIIKETETIDNFIDQYNELDREVTDAEQAVDYVSELSSNEESLSTVKVIAESLNVRLKLLENRWGVSVTSAANALAAENFQNEEDAALRMSIAVESFKSTLTKIYDFSREALEKVIAYLMDLIEKAKKFFNDMGPGINRLEQRARAITDDKFNIDKYRQYLKKTGAGALVVKELGLNPEDIDSYVPADSPIVEASRKIRTFLEGYETLTSKTSPIQERANETLRSARYLSIVSKTLTDPLKALSEDLNNKPEEVTEESYLDALKANIEKVMTAWDTNKPSDQNTRVIIDIRVASGNITPDVTVTNNQSKTTPNFIPLLTTKHEILQTVSLMKDLLTVINSLEDAAKDSRKIISNANNNIRKSSRKLDENNAAALKLVTRITNKLASSSLKLSSVTLRELAYAIESCYILVNTSIAFMETSSN